ncbi:MAG: hypothetical protein IJY14_02480 [Acholeplasmatales bacterium]|nr:hypothetical protein [Acholeplasmatales bacterium]
MSLKEAYLNCRTIIKKFIKSQYWTTFSSADIFYILEGANKSLFTFVEQFFNESFGCQVFFTKKGFNYVHDILTTDDDGVLSLCDSDCLCAICVAKKDLTPDDIAFLKKLNVRINDENNLLVYRFEPGYGQRLANRREMELMSDYFDYISSIISNEYNDVIEAFKQNNVVLALMDKANLQYSVVYRPLPYLEEMPKKRPKNKGFVEEFTDTIYVNDECYLFGAYLPIVVKETNIRPFVIYAYYPHINKHYFKYIVEAPKEYKNRIFGILYDVFTKIGVPTKIIYNDRDIYSMLYQTVNALNIEQDFIREKRNVDANLNDLIAKVYTQANQQFVESQEIVEMLMDTISKCINELSEYSDEDFLDDGSDFDLVS